MYGLVNTALQQLVSSRFGDSAWERIKRSAGVDTDVFVSIEAYPDDVTYALVRAATEVLGLSADEVLEAFGEHWVSYTAQEGYGELLKLAGDSLPVFLQNLDNLHTRVGLMFPHLKPPSFWCTDIGDESLRLHYRPGVDSREGLGAFVVGLIRGLGRRFKTEVAITQTAYRRQGADHDEFAITFKSR